MNRLQIFLLSFILWWGHPVLAQEQADSCTLFPGQTYSLVRPGGSVLDLYARLEYAHAAGAACVLEITANGKPLGSLRNKAAKFTFRDGRTLPYVNPKGAWCLFFSPDFSENNLRYCAYFVTTDQGQAYLYSWKLPGARGKKVKIQLRHTGTHAGKKVDSPVILRVVRRVS